MTAKIAVCMLVTLFASTGCEKRVEAEHFEVINRQQRVAEKRPSTVENVQEGLTMKEVEAVLGSPSAVRTGKVTRPVNKDFIFTTWIYKQDGKEVELSFVDGKLQGNVDGFKEPPMHERERAPDSAAPLIMKNGPRPDAKQEER